MNVDNYNIGNCNELIDLVNINVDTEAFYKIIEIVKSALRKLGINPEGLHLYYQRNFDATSILAIQVTQGDNSDKNNYMFNGCKTFKHDFNVYCDVYMHSEAKSAQKSMKLANLIAQDVVNFFEKTEKVLLQSNDFDLSLSLMVPLDIKKEKDKNIIKKLVKRMMKNNRNK